MALPAGWPPRAPSGSRSLRVFLTGSTTNNFADNAYLFSQVTSANTYTPLPIVKAGAERQNVVVPPTPWGSGALGNDAVADPHIADTGAPTPMIWCRAFIIHNTGSLDLFFSFDGVNTHGIVKAGTIQVYFDRFEAGISFKTSTSAGTGTADNVDVNDSLIVDVIPKFGNPIEVLGNPGGGTAFTFEAW